MNASRQSADLPLKQKLIRFFQGKPPGYWGVPIVVLMVCAWALMETRPWDSGMPDNCDHGLVEIEGDGVYRGYPQSRLYFRQGSGEYWAVACVGLTSCSRFSRLNVPLKLRMKVDGCSLLNSRKVLHAVTVYNLTGPKPVFIHNYRQP